MHPVRVLGSEKSTVRVAVKGRSTLVMSAGSQLEDRRVISVASRASSIGQPFKGRRMDSWGYDGWVRMT